MNGNDRPGQWAGVGGALRAALFVAPAMLAAAPGGAAAAEAPPCTAEATHYTCACTMTRLDGKTLARYRLGRERMYELCRCPAGDAEAHAACRKGLIRAKAGCPRDEVGWCAAEAERATKVWQAKHPKR